MDSSGTKDQPAESGGWAGAFVVKVAADHRVLIPKVIRESVVWLVEAGSSVNCEIRWLGDVPALELQPCTEEIGQPAAEFSSQFHSSEPHHRQLLRTMASRWQVKIERHGQMSRFTLPEPIRRIGLLPGKNGDLVLMGYQDILEMWKPEDWYENLRNICRSESAQMARQLSTIGTTPPRRKG